MPAKDRRSITLNFGPEDFDDLAADAAAAGYETPSAYVSSLVESRGEPLPPLPDRDSEGKMQRLLGQLELLQGQLDAALARAAGGGLAGVPDRAKEEKAMSPTQMKKAIDEGVTAMLEKRDAETLKASYGELKADHKALQKDFDKLEDEHIALLKRLSPAERLDKALPSALGMLAKVAVEKFPDQAAGIVQSLAGFGMEGAAPAPQLGPSLSPELAELCREMSTILNPQQLDTTVNIVNGLLDWPQLLPSVEKAVALGAKRCATAATAAPASAVV